MCPLMQVPSDLCKRAFFFFFFHMYEFAVFLCLDSSDPVSRVGRYVSIGISCWASEM